MIQKPERYKLLKLISPINTDRTMFILKVNQFHLSLKSYQDTKIVQ